MVTTSGALPATSKIVEIDGNTRQGFTSTIEIVGI